MKILEMSPVFPLGVGGLEKCVYEIAKGLARRGHEVVVYTTARAAKTNKVLSCDASKDDLRNSRLSTWKKTCCLERVQISLVTQIPVEILF